MEYICPACGGPNEEPANTKLITCAWCGKSFRIQPVSASAQSPASPASASDNAYTAVSAAARSTSASAEIVKAAQARDLADDPAKTAEIAAAAAKAAQEAMAAARAAANAANATLSEQQNLLSRQQEILSRQQDLMRSSATPSADSVGQGQPAQGAGTSAPASTGASDNAGRRYIRKKFADAKTGIVLATAAVPEGFSVGGTLTQKWQSDLVPFTASIRASSPDNRVFFSSTSGEFFTYYLNPLVRSMAAKVPNAILSQLRNFVDPDEYLHQYARSMAGVPLTPVARAALPTPFGKNLREERNRLIQYTQSHAINISVQIAYSTFYCDAFLYRYDAVVKGRRTVILAGCDYKGVESYDASNSLAAISPLAGAAGLFAGGMQGGLLGGLMQNKKAKASSAAAQGGTRSRAASATASPTGVGADGIPFGHGKEHGKRVDEIDWGADRLYFMAAPAEEEKAATAAFLQFISSLTPDPALWKRRSLLIEQMHQQRFAEAAQLNRQATQMQIQAQQRQRELARQLQQNSEEISRGIMDSWEKQSASHSRMSENWSQAIRGVDTWQTSSGRTVEASVSADHVYQNRYGDTIEVSGPALDDELASRLDWTELNKID
ncbi:MAG: hypothetical protein Q4F43_08790 [Eubacteriales bacterium]|nr:hypothetical protein [Eubacteriales bacterium]